MLSLGAYVLPGDPVWLEQTLAQYYPLVSDLVVPVPRDGTGWTGVPIPVDECLAVIRRADVRGIVREIAGSWVDPADPMAGETAQRQTALDALAGRVDWVLQLDGDEFLPDPGVVATLIDEAEAAGVSAVEMPMRVLFRRTRRHVLEIAERNGGLHHEYPGAVLVRPEVRLVQARRTGGSFHRVIVAGAEGSLQLRRPAEPGEHRTGGLAADQAIVHNSWARPAADIRRKATSWGHAGGITGGFRWYYASTWWPSPTLWRWMRDLHPFARGLWPRLRRIPNAGVVADRPTVS